MTFQQSYCTICECEAENWEVICLKLCMLEKQSMTSDTLYNNACHMTLNLGSVWSQARSGVVKIAPQHNSAALIHRRPYWHAWYQISLFFQFILFYI